MSAGIRFKFYAVFAGAVLIISFLFGLASGLRTPAAAAGAPPMVRVDTVKQSALRTLLPRGVFVAELGDNMTLNGKETDMVAFNSGRSVKELMIEQVKRWEEQGYLARGMTTEKRGAAFAVDLDTGRRFSFTAWNVPPLLRDRLSNGYDVQGFAGEATAASSDVQRGIPDFPTVHGAKIGAVVGSDDLEGRTYTGTYTNSGSIEKNMRFYREELLRRGWTADSGVPVGSSPAGPSAETGYQHFKKGGAQLTLLFTETPRDGRSPVETVVTVIRVESARGGRSGV